MLHSSHFEQNSIDNWTEIKTKNPIPTTITLLSFTLDNSVTSVEEVAGEYIASVARHRILIRNRSNRSARFANTRGIREFSRFTSVEVFFFFFLSFWNNSTFDYSAFVASCSLAAHKKCSAAIARAFLIKADTGREKNGRVGSARRESQNIPHRCFVFFVAFALQFGHVARTCVRLTRYVFNNTSTGNKRIRDHLRRSILPLSPLSRRCSLAIFF